VTTGPTEIPINWSEGNQTRTVALNVGGRYMNLSVELVVGLLMLPFNTHYLGASDYGLWMLAASIVAYFPVLDLGYGGAMERFVAHYRTQRHARAINEIASTLVFVFAAIGLAAFGLLAVVALNLGNWFDLPADQRHSGAIVMMLVGAQFALGLPFAIFGAIVNGFQRQYLNAAVGATVSIAVAIVNVAVVFGGGSLVVLVGAMTAARMTGYLAYRLNAYRVFPMLRIRPSLFRVDRLKEVSRFSVYMLIQDLSVKANYATDPVVIAAVLMTGAVAVWTIAQRLADVVLQLTNQLNHVLFPIVVDADSARRDDRLQELLVQGTRLSLATVLPVAGSLALLAHPVVIGWTGHEYEAAALILPILCMVVIVRVGTWTASTVLVGAGHHRLVAVSNLIAAAVNIGLSILLIHWFGLPGVAVATLIPVVLRGTTVILPMACRRVGLPLLRFLRSAIWPALWPAVLTLGGLVLLRDTASASLWAAVLKGAVVGAIYAVLFLGVAVGREDRLRYLGKLRMITGRPLLKAA
jgi:O-antigen/teichoic acid export membrane protein